MNRPVTAALGAGLIIAAGVFIYKHVDLRYTGCGDNNWVSYDRQIFCAHSMKVYEFMGIQLTIR